MAMQCSIVRDQMLEVLYGEATSETARRVEEHLAVCAACRDEMAAFRSLRRDLSEWKEPALERAPRVVPVVRQRRVLPMAAAAGFLLAVGAGLAFSGSEVRFEDGRLSFRLGRESAAMRELQAAEAQHRREIAELRARVATVATSTGASSEPSAAVLEQVQSLVRESEERQAQRLETSLRDLSARSEAQRRYDLARVSAGLSYLDGKTGQHVARTTELMGYVLQAAEQK
jgi:anti-sigma factor RsiW